MPLTLIAQEAGHDGCAYWHVVNQFGDQVGTISETDPAEHREGGNLLWSIGGLAPIPQNPQTGRENTLEAAKAGARRWRRWLAEIGSTEETWRYVSPGEWFRREAMKTFEREGKDNLGPPPETFLTPARDHPSVSGRHRAGRRTLRFTIAEY